MTKLLAYLRKAILVLLVLTGVGFGIDYYLVKEADVFTLFFLCLLIVTMLVLLVVWLFRMLIQKDR